jgi:hypothetical protein
LGAVMGGGNDRSFVIITERHAASHWATFKHGDHRCHVRFDPVSGAKADMAAVLGRAMSGHAPFRPIDQLIRLVAGCTAGRAPTNTSWE